MKKNIRPDKQLAPLFDRPIFKFMVELFGLEQRVQSLSGDVQDEYVNKLRQIITFMYEDAKIINTEDFIMYMKKTETIAIWRYFREGHN